MMFLTKLNRKTTKMKENELSSMIIGCAIDVHTELGPGLLESVYEECLYYELINLGFKVEIQKPIPIFYKGEKLESKLRLDMVVEDQIIVEIKSVKELTNIHTAQILTYLKLSDIQLGLLINFNEYRIKNGLKRFINSKYKQE